MTIKAQGHYNAGAIGLHWLIALLLLTNIGLAWCFSTLTPAEDRAGAAAQVDRHHRAAAELMRLGWRDRSPAAAACRRHGAWERWAAHAVHELFYVLMLGMPLTGWALVSASPLHPRPSDRALRRRAVAAITPLANLPDDR